MNAAVQLATGSKPLIEVENLKVHFPIRHGLLRRQVGAVRAVDDVSFNVYEGETLGLVGESGCGKSTTGLAVLNLLEATTGEVRFRGQTVTRSSEQQMRPLRRHMMMVFQDPYSSLNPRMTVGTIIGEPLSVHQMGGPAERAERVQELLRLVGLNPAFINRYPHEFSGGQRQRIGIARALATSPAFIVADEPISALDVSIQAQVVNLMSDLKAQLGLTYLMISHDLSMVRYISDRVAVMYLGKIVEVGSRDSVFDRPLHPYTRALMSAVPVPNPKLERERKRIILEGDVPSPSNPPAGCRFHPRCAFAEEVCRHEEPALRVLEGSNSAEHRVACHLAEKLAE
ncbi:MAG: ATP-binding cassette domain-containing protein [Caldilineaceae bacterium]|jgi:oligopeptide/dipeptide ABC transporter ATP-binding protein|nr:ATP-binding cassette domain-containing protein [Caldilineaceae bacterium]